MTDHGFVELGRTTLESDADSISVSDFAAKKHLIIVFNLLPSGAISGGLSFNGDNGSNYTYRTSLNNGADANNVSQTKAYPHSSTQAYQLLHESLWINRAGFEKVGIGQTAEAPTGAGNGANKIETSMKWANAVDQITTVQVSNAGAGSYAAGSELIIYGKD